MVEGAALEKQCAGNRTEGSNPSLSAMTERLSKIAARPLITYIH